MKAPTWEPSAGALLAFLQAATSVRVADLYTFVLTNGATYRFTSGDAAATVNGNTFVLGPKLTRDKVRLVVGVQVGTLRVDVAAEASVLLGSVPFIQALAAGLLDGARTTVERLYMDSANVKKGTLMVFTGRVGEVQTERGVASVEVVSDTVLLDTKVPGAVYQPYCRNTVYDAVCSVSKAARAVAAVVQASPAPTLQVFAGNTSSSAAGLFDLGSVTFTSGLNNGISRTVKVYTTAGGYLLSLVAPLPFVPAAGDAFNVYPGCDKTKSTCLNRFSNLANFRAEPFVPPPESVT